MAYGTLIFSCIAALITLNQASAFEGIPHPHFNLTALGLPEIPTLGFPLDPITLFSSLPFLGSLGRSKRQVEPSTDNMDEQKTQVDAPISREHTFLNCNTTGFNSSCLNCREILICSRNFGLIRSCLEQHQYCSEGRCTNQKPTDCANV